MSRIYNSTLATHLIMFGEPLRALSTTSIWKQMEGSRLIAEPDGNNDKDWAIRG